MRTPSACQAVCKQAQREQKHHIIRNTYPEPETEKERSSVDFPQVGFSWTISCKHISKPKDESVPMQIMTGVSTIVLEILRHATTQVIYSVWRFWDLFAQL